MRGLLTLTWVEAKLFVREPLAAFFTLVFPMLLLLLFGTIFGNTPAADSGGFGFIDAAVPGYAAIVIATSGLLSLSTNLAGYRDLGVLRRLRATPLHPFAILVAQAAVMFVMTLAGTASLIVVGSAVFGLRCAGHVVALTAAFVLCCAALFALGFVVASVAPSVRSAQATALAVFYPMMFLSGAAIPRELLPPAVQRTALVLPLTHAVTLLQALWLGASWRSQLTEVAILTGVAAVATAAAISLFRWE